MQTVLTKLQQLTDGYRVWAQNHPAYTEAISHASFMDEAMRQNFENCLTSDTGCDFTGIMNIMCTRINYFEHHALLQVLAGKMEGWHYFDRAYDNAWWIFRAGIVSQRTVGDLPFLLAYSHLTGYHNRCEYIGHFLYDHPNNKLAELILQHNDTARFMTVLWAHEHGLPLTPMRPYHNLMNPSSPYAILLENLDTPDGILIQDALDKALNDHLLNSANKNSVLHRSIMSHLFPVEILYYLNLRNKRGQTTLSPHGNILWQKFKELHQVQIDDYLQALLEQDEALKRVFYMFVKRGTFQAEEWDYFYQLS